MSIISTVVPSYGRPKSLIFPALEAGKGHIGDEMMLIGAFLFMPLDFPLAQPFRTPFALLLLLYIAMNWRSVVPLIMRAPTLFMLPVLCVLSALWADTAIAALRHGALIGLAMLMAVAFASRLSIRQIAVGVLVSQGLLAIGSVLTMTKVWIGGAGGGLALIGIFPHKNILAQRMVFLAVASLVILLSRGYRSVWRISAMGMLGLALYLISHAMSATAVILLLGAIPLGVGLVLFWRPAAQIRGMRPALVCGAFVAMLTGFLVLTNVYNVDPLNGGLEAFGKDSTLTGRTVVWAAGNEAIRENPVLGVGAGNFWRADNITAVRVADRFYNEDGQFRFHNAYYEVMVHLGIIGLLVAIYSFGRGVLLTLSTWWREQIHADIFFVVMIAVLLVRSFTESELFYPMAMGPILFWMATFNGLSRKTA